MFGKKYKKFLMENISLKRGHFGFDENMARFTWFKVGGPADLLFLPKDEQNLCKFLCETPSRIPITILGNSSNVLIRDGGVAGVVIRLKRNFASIRVEGEEIIVGAGAAGLSIAKRACEEGIEGFEFLSGIPGTAGGALRMNAGAYGSEIKDIFLSARVVNSKGEVSEVNHGNISFGYRHTDIESDLLILEIKFIGARGIQKKIAEHLDELALKRGKTQPIRKMTGGSTFKNPMGREAWSLIHKSGCRGLKCGNAMVSNLHCNFLVNLGNATAKDIETLGEHVRERVYDKTGVSLEWEIERIGRDEHLGKEENCV